jgi:hypothetical protein
MTGRQDDRKEYDRTKDRQRTLGKYMVKIYETVLTPISLSQSQVYTKAVENRRLFDISTTNVSVSNVGHRMYCKSEERRLESDNVASLMK